jgi:hypothetical protein
MPRFLANGLVALLFGGIVVGCDRTPATSPSTLATGFTISGVVHQPAPEADVPVANARVQIAGNTKLQEAVVTDAQGRFTLPPTSVTDFELTFSKEDYLDTRYAVTALSADRFIDVAVPPLMVTRDWSGTLDRDPSGTGLKSVLTGWPGDYTFTPHRSGDLSLELEVGCFPWGTYTAFDFILWPSSKHDDIAENVGFLDPYGSRPEPAHVLLYRLTKSLPVSAGQAYWLSGSLTGYIYGPCPWTLRLTRPG